MELFDVLRELQGRGTAIIVITHKLDEVLAVADRVTVLRRGKKVATLPIGGRDRAGPGRADGRPRGAAARSTRSRARPATPVLAGRGPARASTTATWRPSAGSRCPCARARSSASPASTATARRSSSRRSPACARACGGRDPRSRAATSRGASPREATEAGVGAHPRGPPPARPGARLLAGRERRAARLRAAADRAPAAGSRRGAMLRARAPLHRAVRRARRRPHDARPLALGRQPAEARAGARDPVRPAAAPRLAAHARPRRRRHRVRAPPPGRAARRRPRPSCSSRSSWTRSWASPTASSCIYEGRIVLERAAERPPTSRSSASP